MGEETVIIGAGVAGLTAGICLAQTGRRVRILERGGWVGGNLIAWERGGCTVDNCLHWLTGTRKGSELYRLWERIGMLGEGIGIRQTPYFYRSVGWGHALSLWRDPDRARDEMLALSPVDRRQTERLFSAIAALREGASAIRRITTLAYYARLSLSELAERFHHPLIRAHLTDYIGGEFSSLGLLLAYAAYLDGNADLPEGGSGAAAERIEARFLSLGGVIERGARVMRVITDGRRIKALLCADGRAFLSESVIFACDPHETFGTLLPSSLAPRGLLRADRVGGYPTLSSIHVAFSAKRREVPFRGTVCINGRIGCLAARAHGRMAVRAFDHEPSFARDGETVLQVMLFVTGDEADAWIALRENDPCAYEREKSALTDGARAALLAEFPSLGGSLAHLDTWTPATYRRYTGAYRGDYIGYVLEGMRMPLCLPAKIKGYENAYLASGWQSMPSGLPSAARAGERAADCLVRRLHRRK